MQKQAAKGQVTGLISGSNVSIKFVFKKPIVGCKY
jgi:hypothetical protein